MEVVIVTGASRGIGAALVAALLSPGRRVIGVARGGNERLEIEARKRGAWLDWYMQDLAEIDTTEVVARSICEDMPRDASRYVLINNAGVAEPVSRVEDLTAQGLTAAMNVNVNAAILFAAHFARVTVSLEADKRVLNISSGAGRNPLEGWGAYSTTKAALDMFTRVLKLEQAARPYPLRVVSLAPGIVDTEMQAQTRSQDLTRFPQVQRFRDFKADGKLASPEDTARRIVEYLDRDDFGEREIDDLRNF
jgi:benzil reductase ((S)-benzoin forming)